MGLRFRELCDEEPFAIQTRSVAFDDRKRAASVWVEAYAREIEARGGTGGFLVEEAPTGWPATDSADAFVFALDNALS